MGVYLINKIYVNLPCRYRDLLFINSTLGNYRFSVKASLRSLLSRTANERMQSLEITLNDFKVTFESTYLSCVGLIYDYVWQPDSPVTRTTFIMRRNALFFVTVFTMQCFEKYMLFRYTAPTRLVLAVKVVLAQRCLSSRKSQDLCPSYLVYICSCLAVIGLCSIY